MTDFQTILLEGLFYEQGDNLFVSVQGCPQKVADTLQPLVGVKIKIAVHYHPPHGVEKDKWGAGSCMWAPSPCPAGHHEQPDRMLNVHGEGMLGTEMGQWWLDQDDGTRLELPFALLPGHYGRILGVTVFDPATMGEIVPEQIAMLEGQTTNLQAIMEQLRQFKEKL